MGYSIYHRSKNYPKSYDEAKALYEGRAPRYQGKPLKLGNNTFLDETLGAYGVFLHNTCIVEFLSDGAIVLNTGGWQTPTTRDRINCCGIRIWTTSGIVSVAWGDRNWLYNDRMILMPSGAVLNIHDRQDPAEAIRSRRRKLRKGVLAPLARSGPHFLYDGQADY